MQKFMINGGNRLKGTIRTSGSKNATLPLLAACILCSGKSVIHEAPKLKDVEVMQDLLIYLGAEVARHRNSIEVDTSALQSIEISEELMRRMRASNLVLGALLGRFGRVRISYPGGCQIGSRPMNLHLKGLRELGANIEEKFGYITAEAQQLHGADIHLDLPSVGATENILMAAIFAKGVTTIKNAAKEPEIVDLQSLLNKMGARVTGAGTDTIKIEGVAHGTLKPAEHKVIPDRIEAGTHLVACAITEVTSCHKCYTEHLEPVLAKLRECNVNLTVYDDRIRVQGNRRIKPVDIKTLHHPGFPTDMQPQMMALLSVADGTSIITETIFENRFKHVAELRRMGADITVEGQSAIIKGVDRMSGAYIEASDLRAGAALVLAALAAENGTVIGDVEHIDRGYERLEVKI